MSAESPISAPAPAPAGAGAPNPHKQPLDEMMLAMDVVDTLRRRERVVQTELDEAGREEDLKERLRKIYAAQGIDVPDRVIEQGVAALKEERFAYKPPPDSLTVKLARLYVSRGRWGKWVGGIAGAGVLAAGVNYFAVVAPNAALPKDLAELHREVAALAVSPDAKARVDQVYGSGETALREGNRSGAKEAMGELKDLGTVLDRQYTIRIVNRPGERTGVWRIPDINARARNFYILVEAVDPSGKVLTVPIKSEETGKTAPVKVWGLRVDEPTFQSVADDKRDDGIVERDRFGYKNRGELAPHYEMKTTGGAITAW